MMNLSEIAELTDGTLEQGGAEIKIDGAAGLDIATASDITFVANPKYTPQIQTTKARAILVGPETRVERDDLAVIRTEDEGKRFQVNLLRVSEAVEVPPTEMLKHH